MAAYKEVFGKKGKKIQVSIRIKGYPPVYKTFEKKSEAKIWAEDVEVQMKKGLWKNNSLNDTSIKTVRELIEYFKKNEAHKRYSNPEKYNAIYNWWIDKIGGLKVCEVTPAILIQCRNMLSDESLTRKSKEHKTKSNGTVRKYLFALSAIFRYADRELEIMDRNPISKIDKPKKSSGVVRFLSDTERTELFAACKKHSDLLYTFVILATFSGGRYSELLNLKIENIDFENNIIHFLQTKNGESRGVPIYYKITEILKNYIAGRNITSGYIFVNEKGKRPCLKNIFEKVVKKSNVEKFRFHDLRHTYASYLAQNGAELLEIAELLGHKSLNQVRIYAHLTQKHTSKLVRKMTANMMDFD